MFSLKIIPILLLLPLLFTKIKSFETFANTKSSNTQKLNLSQFIPEDAQQNQNPEAFANKGFGDTQKVDLNQFITEDAKQNADLVESNFGKIKSHQEQAKHRQTKEEYENHYLMHDYCNMFLPHLEHPKLATDEKNSFDLWIEHVTKTCIAEKDFMNADGCDKESEFQIKKDELRVKMFKDGKTQFRCTVPTEQAKVGEIVAMIRISPNHFYLLAGFLLHRFFIFIYAPDGNYTIPTSYDTHIISSTNKTINGKGVMNYLMRGVHPIFNETIEDGDGGKLNLFDTFGIIKTYDRYVTTVKKMTGMKNTLYLLEGVNKDVPFVESFPIDLYDRTRGRFKASLGPGEKFQCGPSFASPVTHQAAKLACYNKTAEVNECCIEITACYDRCDEKEKCDDKFCDCLEKTAEDNIACLFGQQGVCSIVRSAGYITYVTSGYKCVAQAVIDGVSYAVKEGIGWNEIKSVWNGAKTAGKSLARIASGLFG
uniref:Uncharacterized protein n=1 Tax=Meloidogyne floridensis TaxID=298350 RepID=A0A915P680_9BILA